MHYRPFGSTGLTVSELGFGCAYVPASDGGTTADWLVTVRGMLLGS